MYSFVQITSLIYSLIGMGYSLIGVGKIDSEWALALKSNRPD